jgi:hypothetical protein
MNYYETFIGSLTPAEFVAPFADAENPVEAAIANVIDTWPWDCSIPEDFIPEVYAYVAAQIIE